MRSRTHAKPLPGALPAWIWSVRSGSDRAAARAVSGGARLCPLHESCYRGANLVRYSMLCVGRECVDAARGLAPMVSVRGRSLHIFWGGLIRRKVGQKKVNVCLEACRRTDREPEREPLRVSSPQNTSPTPFHTCTHGMQAFWTQKWPCGALHKMVTRPHAAPGRLEQQTRT